MEIVITVRSKGPYLMRFINAPEKIEEFVFDSVAAASVWLLELPKCNSSVVGVLEGFCECAVTLKKLKNTNVFSDAVGAGPRSSFATCAGCPRLVLSGRNCTACARVWHCCASDDTVPLRLALGYASEISMPVSMRPIVVRRAPMARLWVSSPAE